MIDDIGMLPAGQAAAEAFYRLVDAAYERRSVAVRDSRVNQATRIPASMTACAIASTKWDFPVPEVKPTDCNICVRCCRARSV